MYDLIIIGGGPSGLTAAIYAARFDLKAVIIAKEIGGYMAESPQIENYPGFISISGLELAELMKKQVEHLGVKIIEEEVVEVKKGFSVKTKSNTTYQGKNILIAMGTERRKLGIPGEDEFAGRGVAYCATCDAALFRNKVVAVVGGANSAVVSALLLAKFAKEVHILYRNKPLRADAFWIDKLKDFKNIEVHCCTTIKEIKGSKKVEKVILQDDSEMKLDGVFIEIGSIPVAGLSKSLGVELDENGCIKVNLKQETNIKGIYAAGDITGGSNNLRQIITACAEGAVAVDSINKNK
jgi:thioredoxin reductase (NADPH)